MDTVSEICARFQDFSGPKRVELMCSLIRMCLPLELRFIGTCIEDIAKKDFFYLREDENKANDVTVLHSLTNVHNDVTRSRLNVYLSLLNSSNTLCSGVLFNTLRTCFDPNLPNSSDLSNNFLDELLLLLTLAANHPAFTFNQRHILNDRLNIVRQICDERLPKPEPTAVHVTSDPPASHVGPKYKPPKPAHIVDIQLAAAHMKAAERKYEFHIQVKWSDGHSSDLYSTYQELQSFHSELVRLFPKESGAHRQDRVMPFFPQEKSHPPNQMDEQIRIYISKLASLPENILHCAHVSSFMRQQPPPAYSSWDLSPAPSPRSHSTLSPASTDEPGHLISKPGIPVVSRQSLNYSPVVSCESPPNSPAPSSHPSPHMSPALSPNSGVRGTNLCDFEINQWLKKIRLHKYSKNLSPYSLEELLCLTDQDLDSAGLTKGAQKKFRSQLEKLCNAGANGLQFSSDNGSSATPSSPLSPWHGAGSPTTNGVYLRSGAGSTSSRLASSPASMESTPGSSQYSSPTASPDPEQKQQHAASSSDEEDFEQDTEEQLSNHMKSLELSVPQEANEPRLLPPPSRATIPPGMPILQPSMAPGSIMLPPFVGMEHLVRPPHHAFPLHPQQLLFRHPLPQRPLAPHNSSNAAMPPGVPSGQLPVPPPPPMGSLHTGPGQSHTASLLTTLPRGAGEERPQMLNGIPVSCKDGGLAALTTAAPTGVNALTFMTCSMVHLTTSAPVTARPSSLHVPGKCECPASKALETVDGEAVAEPTGTRPPSLPPTAPSDPPNLPPSHSVMATTTAATTMSLPATSGYQTPPPRPGSGYQTPPPPTHAYQTATPPPHASGYQTPPMPGYQTPPYLPATSQSAGPLTVPPGLLTSMPASAPPPASPAVPPTPTSTPTPAGPPPLPGCSSCGCSGHCSSAPRGTPFPFYPWAHLLYQAPVGLLPTSNGLVNPGMAALPYALHSASAPAPTHPPHTINGLSSEVYYPPHGAYLPAMGHPPQPTPTMLPFHVGAPATQQHSGPNNNNSGSSSSSTSSTSSNGSCKLKGTGSMCCNCGSPGHVISECKEPNFESVGQYHLNLQPKAVEQE